MLTLDLTRAKSALVEAGPDASLIIIGTDGDDILYGPTGDDQLYGLAGHDWLLGGEGNDVLIGGAGADVLVGGVGLDTASYATAASGVYASLFNSNSNVGDAAFDTYSGIENLTGSAFLDILIGDNQANALSGGAGHDVLVGVGGDDVLIGDDGNDALAGWADNDVLRGGLGADTLNGGLGDDVFDFDGVADSAPGAHDIIEASDAPAFEGAGVAGGDVIDLSGIDANTAKSGDQAFAFGGAGVGKVSAVNSGTDTLIRCNIDKDAAFEFELLIEDGAVLASTYKAADFFL